MMATAANEHCRAGANGTCAGKSNFAAIAMTVWLCLVLASFSVLLLHNKSESSVDHPLPTWPGRTALSCGQAPYTLVMFVHPHCPCTRASLTELAILMARCQGRLNAYAVFYRPAGYPDTWQKTDTWYRAESIPGVKVLSDDGGTEAKVFHATVSGQSILYDRKGELLFAGGITAARGHEGDNLGLSVVETAVLDGKVACHHTDAFGCSLVD